MILTKAAWDHEISSGSLLILTESSRSCKDQFCKLSQSKVALHLIYQKALVGNAGREQYPEALVNGFSIVVSVGVKVAEGS